MQLYILLFALVCFVSSPTANAMTIEVQGNKVFATGPVGDDLRQFEEAFAKGGIDTVVFVNSPGGDLWNGLRVGRLIADKGYNTVLAGSCVSACSIMFMGGKERRFSDAFRPTQTFIGIHGAHNRDTGRIDPVVQPQIFAFYKQNMGEKFNSSAINQALYEMDDAGSLLRVFDPVRSAKTLPYHCQSSQTPRGKCTTLNGVDASSLGIITHSDLVKLDLPTAFKTVPTVLGKPLEVTVPDLAAYYAELATRQCSSDGCKTATPKLIEQAENRAVATPLQGQGRGSSFNADTPMNAVVRAVYGCNHMAGLPVRLCNPEVVNQYDVRPIYSAALASHKLAFSKLTLPSDKFYANEEYGGSFVSATALRAQAMSDMTPSKLEGIDVLATQELVRRMLSDKPPVLVDVLGSYDTIPQSVVLLFAGIALDNADLDEALGNRIADLLALLAPDPHAPVVFFCTGRNCWHSVNAALRAKKFGYTRVGWYRGGIESWKAAGLPTATSVVQAVAR